MQRSTFTPLELAACTSVTPVKVGTIRAQSCSRSVTTFMRYDHELKSRVRRGGGVFVSLCVLLGVFAAPNAEGATRVAASCQLSDVQAAVGSAADGDVIQIPDGSCSWSGGIATTKQIRIEARNYTPTKGGSPSRSVIITNNSSAPLITLTSGNTWHVGVSGISFK